MFAVTLIFSEIGSKVAIFRFVGVEVNVVVVASAADDDIFDAPVVGVDLNLLLVWIILPLD